MSSITTTEATAPALQELTSFESGSIVRIKGQPGLFLRQNRELRPIPEDLAFALGSLFGLFDAFDGGRDTDGTRLLFTRRILLEGVFGAGWTRYAKARLSIRPGAKSPVRIVGLPGRKQRRRAS